MNYACKNPKNEWRKINYPEQKRPQEKKEENPKEATVPLATGRAPRQATAFVCTQPSPFLNFASAEHEKSSFKTVVRL